MNVTEASQIVVDPSDEGDAKLERRLAELALSLPNPGWKAGTKLWIGMVIHALGIHTWVRHKRYDEVSDRLVDVGRVCMFCSQGLR